jgi:uncharacterized protein YaiI (UPF0178 family)
VTQDYGVAAMALGKGAFAIHQNGKIYTEDNIDLMLMERHMAKKSRRAGERVGNNAKKRTNAEDERFMDSFYRLCQKASGSNDASSKATRESKTADSES